MNPETTGVVDLETWQAPGLATLSTALDTANFTGSGSDGGTLAST